MSEQPSLQLPITHTVAPRLKFARAIVFGASFCLMTVELVAGRVMAPYLGVSLYTWTSVIGVILLGVTVGNYAGGQLADRHLSRKILGSCFILAGLATLLANILAPVVGPLLASSSLWLPAATALFCLLVFFPVGFFLSTVSPQVIRFDLHDLEKTGVTIGTLGAWSAGGSILGTFATGFVFIMYVGTRNLLLALAAALILAGVLIAWQHKLWRRKAALAVILLFVGETLVPGFCQSETNYYCIRAAQAKNVDGQATYAVYLDHLIHSHVTPAVPDSFGYKYEWVQAKMAAYVAGPTSTLKTLTIGGGGYSQPRYLEAFYPAAEIRVIEIDPGVTEFNYRHTELSRQTRIQTINQDARLYLSRLPPDEKFDLILGDAVNDFAVPHQITTVEFDRLVRRHLADGGYYSLTLIDTPAYGQFTAAMVRSLRQVFNYVYLFPLGSDLLNGHDRNTFEIVAGDRPLDEQKWAETYPVITFEVGFPDDYEDLVTYAASNTLETFLAKRPAPALTDDFAPTDNYLAPVFSEAY